MGIAAVSHMAQHLHQLAEPNPVPEVLTEVGD